MFVFYVFFSLSLSSSLFPVAHLAFMPKNLLSPPQCPQKYPFPTLFKPQIRYLLSFLIHIPFFPAQH